MQAGGQSGRRGESAGSGFYFSRLQRLPRSRCGLKALGWWPGSTGVVDFGQGAGPGKGEWNEVVGEIGFIAN